MSQIPWGKKNSQDNSVALTKGINYFRLPQTTSKQKSQKSRTHTLHSLLKRFSWPRYADEEMDKSILAPYSSNTEPLSFRQWSHAGEIIRTAYENDKSLGWLKNTVPCLKLWNIGPGGLSTSDDPIIHLDTKQTINVSWGEKSPAASTASAEPRLHLPLWGQDPILETRLWVFLK